MRVPLKNIVFAILIGTLPAGASLAAPVGTASQTTAGSLQPAQFRPRGDTTATMVTVVFTVESTMKIPDDAESAKMRARLYEMANNECAILEKAFSNPCQVLNVQIRDNPMNRAAPASEMKATVNYRVGEQTTSSKTQGKKAALERN